MKHQEIHYTLDNINRALHNYIEEEFGDILKDDDIRDIVCEFSISLGKAYVVGVEDGYVEALKIYNYQDEK